MQVSREEKQETNHDWTEHLAVYRSLHCVHTLIITVSLSAILRSLRDDRAAEFTSWVTTVRPWKIFKPWLGQLYMRDSDLSFCMIY